MEMFKFDQVMTSLTIMCKDGTSRVINLRVRYSFDQCVKLGKDLEGDNYSHIFFNN